MSTDAPLKMFGLLCEQVTAEPSLLIKEEIIRGFLQRFTGDVGLLLKLLLPKYANRVFYTQEKQLVRVLSQVLSVPEDDIKNEWNRNGCIAETALKYFKPTAAVDSSGWCNMTMSTFDGYLDSMASASNEVLRGGVIRSFFQVACRHAVYLLFRELKLDLRLGAGLRVVLNGLHPNAYQLFQHCANIQEVVKGVTAGNSQPSQSLDTLLTATADADTPAAVAPPRGAVKRGAVTAQIKLGVPLAPMLAAPAKGIDQVLAKCPNGAFSEVKYDGERIQIHKQGDKLHFFARSLKPMKADKYAGLETYIQQAVQAHDCILDGEILMVDIKTSVPLPFGTLGKHKKTHFSPACPCVFVFDILFRNGESLLHVPLEERREELKKCVRFTRNRVMYSELCLVKGDMAQRRAILQQHLNRAIAEGLEGLVIKDVKGPYEPRARHWVKLKKDYLDGMADSADLLVLGAWYGSGNKGGLLSTYLMGCIDTSIPEGHPGRYKTVCKVGNGLDDTAITVLSQKYTTLMHKAAGGTPWLDCHTAHTPDVVLRNPNSADVMEIIGAEFSVTKTHTSGISIRFPRILRMRTDKSVSSATTLQELLSLFRTAKEKLVSAGVTDTLQLVDSYIVMEPEEASNSMPFSMTATTATTTTATTAHQSNTPVVAQSAAASAVSASPSNGKEGPSDGSVSYVSNGDATKPSVPDDEDVVLCHSSAVSGRWSDRGFMGKVTRAFGTVAEEAYAQCVDKRDLGDVILTEVTPRGARGRVYVATMLAQQAAQRGCVPLADHDALLKCLSRCILFADQQKNDKKRCSVHIVQLQDNTMVRWREVDAYLREQCALKQVAAVVYGTTPNPPNAPAVVQRPDVAPPCPPQPPQRQAHDPQPDIDIAPPTTTTTAVSPSKEVQAPLPPSWWTLLSKCHVQIISPSPTRQQEMRALAEFLGATVIHAGSAFNKGAAAGCTHAIFDTNIEGYDSTAISGSSQAVIPVSFQWLTDSLRDHTLYAETLYHPRHRAVLSGCRLLVAASLQEHRGHWERLASLLGATVHATWQMVGQRTTYLISSIWDDESEQVFKLGGRVLAPQWLVDSAVAQSPLPPNAYLLPRLKAKSARATSSNPLEGIMCGLKIFIAPEGIPASMTDPLRCAITQLGGCMVGSEEEAQYCITTQEGLSSLSAAARFRGVSPSWVWQCARKRGLQDPNQYLASSSTNSSPTVPPGTRRGASSESSYSTETYVEGDDDRGVADVDTDVDDEAPALKMTRTE